jgi:UDP-N-acetylmuramoyl-tripeptide--D-alanyl-D-alanine ligase
MSFLKKIVVFLLILESKIIVKKYKPFVIAVTGSVGKTSTKDAIYEIAKLHFGFVRKSEKSMNSEIGLPLTIIGTSNAWYSVSGWFQNLWRGFKIILKRSEYPECLVLEIGADHPHDIERVSKWLKTDISVITLIGNIPVHVEFFKNPEELKKEKLFLAKALKDNGTLVLYGDDNMLQDVKVKESQKIVRYGTRPDFDISGKNVEIQYSKGFDFVKPTGISFLVNIADKEYRVSVDNILGKHQMYSILGALSIGNILGIENEKMIEKIQRFDSPRGRMRIIDGINRSTLIDDTYNSSPVAVTEALQTLGEIETQGKRIAILGDMMELGKFGAEAHRKVGELVSGIANLIITIGPRSRLTAEEVLKSGKLPESVLSFDNSKQAIEDVKGRIGKGDIVLIKGSQAMRMEHIVKAIMDQPSQAKQLLVRQEEEWIRKE